MISELQQYRRIAIMGGTFDPIHFGHLATAEAVFHKFCLDKVIFMPAGAPAHKEAEEVSDKEHRYFMTLLATLGNPFFMVSRMELDRQGLSYTIDTIKELKKQLHPEATLFFITGADVVHELFTWREPETLLTLCDFVAVSRPGFAKSKLLEEIENIQAHYTAKFHYVEVPALEISSSNIRQRMRDGLPIKYLLPEAVEEYIMRQSLYRNSRESGEVNLLQKEQMKEKLQKTLSPKRYQHTLNVAEAAEELARIFGTEEEAKKAEIAGLLHDCAKDYKDDMRKRLIKEYHVLIDKVMKENKELIHPFLGAEVAKQEYGIADEEILNAIRYHTTGREAMGLVEKAVFIADYIEPAREPFPELDKARQLSRQDLDLTMQYILEQTIAYVKKKKRALHPLSEEALAYYRKVTRTKEEGHE